MNTHLAHTRVPSTTTFTVAAVVEDRTEEEDQMRSLSAEKAADLDKPTAENIISRDSVAHFAPERNFTATCNRLRPQTKSVARQSEGPNHRSSTLVDVFQATNEYWISSRITPRGGCRSRRVLVDNRVNLKMVGHSLSSGETFWLDVATEDAALLSRVGR